MQKIRGAHLARRRRDACAVNPVFADRRRPMRLKPLREPCNILKKLEAIRIGSIPQYPSTPSKSSTLSCRAKGGNYKQSIRSAAGEWREERGAALPRRSTGSGIRRSTWRPGRAVAAPPPREEGKRRKRRGAGGSSARFLQFFNNII
jgi:hypothetical protein